MAYIRSGTGGGNKSNTNFKLFPEYLIFGSDYGCPKGSKRKILQYTYRKNVNIKITSAEGTGSTLPYARYEVYCNNVLIAYTPYQNSSINIDVTTSSSDSEKTIVIGVYNSSLSSGSMPPIDVTISET